METNLMLIIFGLMIVIINLLLEKQSLTKQRSLIAEQLIESRKVKNDLYKDLAYMENSNEELRDKIFEKIDENEQLKQKLRDINV
jgi:hypothetical protein